MPELPEVETIIRGIRGPLVGRTITGVSATWANSVRTPLTELETKLPGNRIEAIHRRGKYLLFDLSSGFSLILHLKMSGDLFVQPTNEPPPSHVRTTFALDNNHELRFKDPRKFGRVYFVRSSREVVGKLGPEPLAEDFSVAAFCALFTKRRGRLKALLLDQTFIAGIGNIYADEACFRAQVHPLRPAESLTTKELHRLYHAIRAVLEAGILHRGASFDSVYRGGEFQSHFAAYGRTDEPCRRCKTTIRRTTLGARSTHYCPKCQPLPRRRQKNS